VNARRKLERTYSIDELQRVVGRDQGVTFIIVECHVAEMKDECNHHEQILETYTRPQTTVELS